MMATEVFGILVTHGSLGDELVRTAEAIVGPQEGIAVLSNAGASLEDLASRLKGLIEGRAARGALFLFVDLLGGSCGHACQEILRADPRTVLFSGVNLPMFLEFLHQRDRVGIEELRERLLAKGRDGIQCLS